MSNTSKNYYDVLGVRPAATPQEIRAAYIRNAPRYHPLKDDSESAAHSYRLINEAFAALNDPELRALYDAGEHSQLAERMARIPSPTATVSTPAASKPKQAALERPGLRALIIATITSFTLFIAPAIFELAISSADTSLVIPAWIGYALATLVAITGIYLLGVSRLINAIAIIAVTVALIITAVLVDSLNTFGALLVLSIPGSVLVVVFASTFVKRYPGFRFRRLTEVKTTRLIFGVFGIWFGSLLVTAVVNFVLLMVLPDWAPFDNTTPLVEGAGSIVETFIISTLVVIFIPIAEEIIFRGFLLNAIGVRLRLRWAALISAALFAFSHVIPELYIPTFILGCGLAMAYIVYGIRGSIAVHMLQNGFALALAIILAS